MRGAWVVKGMAGNGRKVFPENLPPGWRELLKDEAEKPYFKSLTVFLRQEYKAGQVIFPPQDRVLRALQSLDYPDVKVVILGQDPYHGEGQAVGLCFAVPNSLRPKPPSLGKSFLKKLNRIWASPLIVPPRS